jgi:hypothetical protein
MARGAGLQSIQEGGLNGEETKGSLRRENEARVLLRVEGGIDGGGAGDAGQWPAAALAVSKQRRGGADWRKGMVPTFGPGCSEGERGKKGGADRCELLGRGLLRGPRGEGKKKREGEKRGVWVFLFFKIFSNLFQLFKL